MTRIELPKVLTLAVAAALTLPASSLAQLGPAIGDGPSLRLEVAKPFLDDPGPFAGTSGTTSVWNATVLYPLDAGPTLYGRLGLAHASIEGLPSSRTLSKPTLGVIFGRDGVLRAEAHVDLPLAQEFGDDDYATGVAVLADYEHSERFLTDSWSFGASVSPRTVLEYGATVGGRLGATVLIPTESGADTELFVLYSFFASVPAGSLRWGFEVSGIADTTSDGLSASERSTFFAGVSLGFAETRFSPELFVKAPVDDDLDTSLNLVAGLRLMFGG